VIPVPLLFALAPVDGPTLFYRYKFNCRDLAVTANYLIAMGEERAALMLVALGSNSDSD
jgi:hypothetical protein